MGRSRGHRTSIWTLGPDLDGYVAMHPQDEERVVFVGGRLPLVLSRREARMLARRLNQFLDATVKR